MSKDKQTEVLTSQTAIKSLVAPTGRKYGVVKHGKTSFYKVTLVDGAGEVPGHLQGLYTKPKLAEKDLTDWLKEFWFMSDKKAAELRSK